MTLITKEAFEKLAEARRDHCVSVYIPTNRSGQETMEGKDAIALKNQLKEAKADLIERGLDEKEALAMLQPARELVEDNLFWRFQSDGLALFIAEDIFETYTMPVNFTARRFVSGEFYLKPLIPYFNGDGMFYLLALQLDNVDFYLCTRHSVTDITIKDRVPKRLEDIVGYDYEQKNLQMRSQQGGSGGGLFHGQGGGKEEDKNEILRFFRGVNKGLMSFLHDDQTLPLVVACIEEHFPIYREANTYENLFHQSIHGKPSDTDVFMLHEKAWDMLAPVFDKNRRETIKKFLEMHGSGKTSTIIEKIVPAAANGRIDTLFLLAGTDVLGTFNPDERKVSVEETRRPGNISLMNFAAVKTFLQGGSVYIMEKDEIPGEDVKMSALYRF